MSAAILTELRRLRPGRRLNKTEAFRVAEQQAARLLRIQGLSTLRDAPVPEEVIAHLPRFEVRRHAFDDHVSGVAHWQDGRWVVALNGNQPVVRQRFTLAHELGHILEAPFRSYVRHDIEELVADHFAACVLMPRSWVKQLWGERLQSVSSLARYFEVSEVAMRRRLSELHLADNVLPVGDGLTLTSTTPHLLTNTNWLGAQEGGGHGYPLFG